MAQNGYFGQFGAGVGWRRAPTDTIRFLTLDETARLFRAIGAHRRDRALFLIAYRHRLRASEVGLRRAEDLDLKALRIMVHRLKGSHSGVHPLQPDEAKALKALLREREAPSPILFPSNRGDPIARRTLDWLMKRYGAAADLPPAKWCIRQVS
jgi:type 1 fimbriae regulatory protein FimB/type 1 fimbriae regulatory protein FimE